MRISARRIFLIRWILPYAFLAFILAGCGSNSAPEGTQPSGPLLSIDPQTVGSISGTVTIESNAATANVPVASCSKGNGPAVGPPPDAAEQNSEIAKTVVYLKAGLARYRYEIPTAHVVLDQKGCVYEPHVIALMTNQPLEIRNNDPVAHNIHVLSKVNRPWDHSEPAGVAPIIETFAKPELAVHVICKIHVGMSAYLFIFDNPYFAVPSPSGAFELKNIPPGTYTVEAWQEHFGTQDQTVTISPKQSQTISFLFKDKSSQGD